MGRQFRIDTTYTPSGEPRLKVTITAPKPSDFKARRGRVDKAALDKTPGPYLKLLKVDFERYLKVTAETVPVDDITGLVFLVTTGGGSKGGQYVDAWAEIPAEHPRPGFRALASTRTPWAVWVADSDDFERAGAVEIARVTGVKHPPQHV